jgi:predicted O-methyltransferase YrrM
VSEERCPFYCYSEIEQLRKQFLADQTLVDVPTARGIRSFTVARLVAREGIRPKMGALLFRLTNFFQPRNILQIGPTMGLSTLYLTSYRTGLRCVSLENIPAYATISGRMYAQGSRNPVELYTGDYRELLPKVLAGMEPLEFVFFNTWREPGNARLFEACLPHVQKDAVFVFEGISRNRSMRTFWKYVRSHPQVTSTLDLYTTGVVFFNKNLPKRNYRIYF